MTTTRPYRMLLLLLVATAGGCVNRQPDVETVNALLKKKDHEGLTKIVDKLALTDFLTADEIADAEAKEPPAANVRDTTTYKVRDFTVHVSRRKPESSVDSIEMPVEFDEEEHPGLARIFFSKDHKVRLIRVYRVDPNPKYKKQLEDYEEKWEQYLADLKDPKKRRRVRTTTSVTSYGAAIGSRSRVINEGPQRPRPPEKEFRKELFKVSSKTTR